MAKKPVKSVKTVAPLWAGPDGDGPDGGVTYSLLCRFLTCRERFRIHTMEGLRPPDVFNDPREFGNMWHVCEEWFAKRTMADDVNQIAAYVVQHALSEYVESLCRKYPLNQDDIVHWHGVCETLFPLYVRQWYENPSVEDVLTKTLLPEKVFDVPYTIPSGRSVRLRGKWDSVLLRTKSTRTKSTGLLFLQENKTKGELNEAKIQRLVTFDLQTMLYLVALTTWQGLGDYGVPVRLPDLVERPVTGVLYNVVKRPRHYQGKKETQSEFLDRLYAIVEDKPDEFFARWLIEVSPEDVARFRRQCLDPLLEQLHDWWDCVVRWYAEGRPDTPDYNLYNSGVHWRYPFNVYNSIDEQGCSDVDGYLDTGSTVGLERATTLFPELED